MSKMDNLRAMREAKYAEMAKRTAAAAKSPSPKAPSTSTVKAAPVAAEVAPKAATTAPAETSEASQALCGHRNMSGRSCTREHGHAAKSHRYS